MAGQPKLGGKRHCSKAPQQFKFVANESLNRKRPNRHSSRLSSPPQCSQGNEIPAQASFERTKSPEVGLADNHIHQNETSASPAAVSVTNIGIEPRCTADPSDMDCPPDLGLDSLGPWRWYPTPSQCPTPDYSKTVHMSDHLDMTLTSYEDPSMAAQPGSVLSDSYVLGPQDATGSSSGTNMNSILDLTWLNDPAETQCLPFPSPTNSTSIFPPLNGMILYEGLFEKFGTLLDKYDQEYCVMPLSGDIPSNPFRCRSHTSQGSRFLLHAILAVSCYHTSRQSTAEGSPPSPDVVNHQNTATQLYRHELDVYHGSQGVRLLDTTLVLFTLNASQSGLGDWLSYISDAQKLLSISGGHQMWEKDPRAQAQVVMLLWWDATIGLLSREGCMLPYSYLESLLALELKTSWSFFDVTGCPRELVVPLVQLAALAEENEKALSMRWTRFDMSVVDEIRQSIVNWKNVVLEYDDSMSEEQMHRQQDVYHCSEVWRYGLLIYITRVFYWKRHEPPPRKLAYHARLAIEHVNACRHTAPVQRQVLLALFWAGSETTDQFLRQSIRDYCGYWSRHSGYQLFTTAASLLEEVWAEAAGSADNAGVWWGSVIDSKQKSQNPKTRFCFG
ncbi:hypothetical protein PV08_10491 [Exophiala spinifera]|uniref:Transcription factor domain-containing protein n=1 Tax=Exophiala spinifera TaxID=91928 RepID=A0A0D1Y877_9EURO|nr:uncharacterized protein PV08_10491 [Exophiala spinifera]KIW11191.1 hypothetical protein PV08_10491 [Exophiala spinifera]